MQVIDQVIKVVRDIAQTEVMPRFLHVGARRKHDGSQLTEADLASQAALEKALPQIVPCPVLGEEMSKEEQEQLWATHANTDVGLWVVDPIDGTTNFIHGLPYFAISVALVQNGRSVLGVIYNPASDEMFYATQNGGAYLNGMALPLKDSPTSLGDTIASVEIKYLRSGRLSTRLASLAPCGSQRNLGASTLDWCYVAAGRFDLYLHGGQRLWDYAAGSIILSEAGGVMSTLEEDDYWQGALWQRSVIAALSPTLFESWRRWVRSNL